MITETLLNSLKSLFSSLGAKTSDSNYAVGLFDKTNGEPKGVMGMSDLASVLGVGYLKNRGDFPSDANPNDVEDGIYIGNSFPTNVGFPTNQGILIQLHTSSSFVFKVQFILKADNGKLFARIKWGNSWTGWRAASLDSLS